MISFFLLLFIIAISQEAHQAEPHPFTHGLRTEKKIALTFDACPSSIHGGYDQQIVSILSDSGVPATFFLSGRWIKKHQLQTKKLASIPAFELGNHSFSHPHLNALSDSAIRTELQRTESLLRRIKGTSTHLFRPPYGENDARILHIAQELGITTVIYDLASGDPDSTISRERLARYVISHTRNGSIIVMHINGRGWHTAEVLPQIIQALRKKGFKFVKVSELLAAEKDSRHLSIK